MKSRFELLADYAKGNLTGSQLLYVEAILDDSAEARRELKRIEFLLEKKQLENHQSERENTLQKLEIHQSFSQTLPISKIADYVKGEVSEEEKAEVEKFLQENVFNRETYIDLLLMQKEGELDNYLREQEVKKQDFIYQNFINKSAEASQQKTTKIFSIQSKTFLYSIAATILLLFVIGIGIKQFPKEQSTMTTLGEREERTKVENQANNLKTDLETEFDLIGSRNNTEKDRAEIEEDYKYVKQNFLQNCIEQNEWLQRPMFTIYSENQENEIKYSIDEFGEWLKENGAEKQFRIKEYTALIQNEDNLTEYSIVENGKETKKVVIPNSESCKSIFIRVVLKVN
ncbi:hypothetical protein [Bernardetia sp.]|uniref:hypothetical protein n=1 Tax=Bernardetia sp. TaxID=1937974 RepID=UPI0025BD634D|nr:hypothetical protein [Bernardetia sp.]